MKIIWKKYKSPIIATLTVAIFFIGCDLGQDLSTTPQGDPVTTEPDHQTYQPASPFLSGLPVLKIETPRQIEIRTRDWHTGATYRLYYDGTGERYIEGVTEIRGRGNSTFYLGLQYGKMPFNLRLENTSRDILGMPAHSSGRFALLANFADKTLLRTEVAQKMGAIFNNVGWVPRSRQVILYKNGDFRGVYQLIESIRDNNNSAGETNDRLENGRRLSASRPGGGFILEVCFRRGDPHNWETTRGVVFNASRPDSGLYTVANNGKRLIDIIKAIVQNAEDALYGDNFTCKNKGWQAHLDKASFVDWYLVQEITRNNDAIFHTSVFMYYDPRINRLRMGPIWDFDISSGNVYYNGNYNPIGFWIKNNSPWIARLFQDSAFKTAVQKRWNEKRGELNTIFQFIGERAAYLDIAQAQNFRRWPFLDVWVWPNAVVTGSYAGEIMHLKQWLRTRINWLDGAINAW